MATTGVVRDARPSYVRRFWRATKRLRSNWIAFATVVVAAVAMAEIDRMIEQCVTRAGERYSMAIATGVMPQQGAWFGWATSDPSPAELISLHAMWDVAFAAGYTILGYRLYRSIGLGKVARLWVGMLGVEVVESLTEVVLAAMLPSPNLGPVVWVVVVAGWAKWILFAALFLIPLLSKELRKQLWEHVKWWAVAFFPHRAQLIGISLIGVFALVPKANLFDQYPDLVRSWVTASGLALGTVFDNIVGFVFFAFAAFVLGRLATAAREHVVEKAKPEYWWWALAPLVVGGVVLWLAFTGQEEHADVWRAMVFVLAVVAAPLASQLWEWWSPSSALSEERRAHVRTTTRYDAVALRRMGRAGDLVAGLVLLVFGAGLVRAFSAPVALRYVGESEERVEWVGIVDWPLVLLLVGVATAIFLPPVIAPTVRWIAAKLQATGKRRAGATTTQDAVATRNPVWRVLMILAGSAVVMLWVFNPVDLSANAGPGATIVVITLLLVVIVWNLQASLRLHRPIRVFDWMGFRSDPVLLVIVVIPLFVLTAAPPPQLHPIQTAGDAVASDRATIPSAFRRWEAASTCTVEVAGEHSGDESVHVRPMLLVAAEGGGIRAAAWTTRVIDALYEGLDCDVPPVFLSSGVSGGAVGLTLSRVPLRTPHNDDDHPGFRLAERLAHYRPLAVTLSGLLVGDNFGSVTGLRVPTKGYPDADGTPIWQDRAAHLQHAWSDRVPRLSKSYDLTRSDATGWLVLNSSAVGYGCRVVVSQVDLGLDTRIIDDPQDGTRLPQCSGGAPAVANAIDLHELYGDCALRLDWATAALLSARFPIVSPAGRTGGAVGAGCDDVPDIQLADGGIVDNSGLATIAGLVPDVMTTVREHNARIAESTSETPWVVPIVVYVSNSPGGDIAASAVSASTELEIASSGRDRANAAQNSDHAWLQRIAAGTRDACIDDVCAYATDAVRAGVGDGVAVVAPTSGPTVAAPLGWALSEISLAAIDAEVDSLARKAEWWPSGYGDLAHLVATMNGAEIPDPEPTQTRTPTPTPTPTPTS